MASGTRGQQLPVAVQRFSRLLSEGRIKDHTVVARKLTESTPQLVGMWRALERRNKDDPHDLWVQWFISEAADAKELPPFHLLPASQRRELAKKIGTISVQLADLIERNELVEHLIFGTGRMFPGFMFYEDFGESNRARIDDAGDAKLATSRLIREIGARARQRIIDEPKPGKAGRNHRAILFMRQLAARNNLRYGKPLLAVVATATNTLFDTQYDQSDVQNLMTR
jgi:hypothetical protein